MNGQQPTNARQLVKLKDTFFRFADPSQDIRGRRLVDERGHRLGNVHALYIDKEEKNVHFLEISYGAILGIDGTKFLVPADYIASINESTVMIHHSHDHRTSERMYQPEFEEPSTSREGYDPLYSYPRFPGLHI